METIKNDLRALVVTRRITGAHVLHYPLVKHPSVAEFEAGLRGQTIENVDRKAKYLLISLSSGKILAVQLIITGQLLLVDPEKPLRKSTRLILDLDNRRQLRLADSSRLARAYLLDSNELYAYLPLAELGPEVISDELTLDLFKRLVGSRHRQIKAVLNAIGIGQQRRNLILIKKLRRGRTGAVVYFLYPLKLNLELIQLRIKLKVYRLADIMADKFKIFIRQQMINIFFIAGGKIIQANDPAVFYQFIANM